MNDEIRQLHEANDASRAPRTSPEGLALIERLAYEMGPAWSGWKMDVRALLAEVKRLQGLIGRVAAQGCPEENGHCPWCNAYILRDVVRGQLPGGEPEMHQPICPWREIVAVADAKL